MSAQCPVDSFTVSLHSSKGLHLLAIKACKGTVSGLYKMVEILNSAMSPQCIVTWGNPNLYLDQPMTKGLCQPMPHTHWQSYCHQARTV